jgi:hypothetical protein
LADEIEALRAALHDRERQVEALTQGYHVGVIPGHMTGVTASPGGLVSGLVNSQGEIHHHHHFKKSKGQKYLRRAKTYLSKNI